MRLLVCSTGTHGDVQPCVALARGLADAGHDVPVASVPAYASLIEEAGLERVPLWEPDPRQVMRDVQQGTLGRSAPVRLFKHLFRRRPPPADALARQVEICRGRDFVLSPITNYLHATESLGVPFAFLALYPTLPTRQFPHHLSRLSRSLGGPLNRLTHLAFRQLFWIPDRPWVNRWRTQLGLEPLGGSGPHPHACRRGVPYLFGYSPTVLPAPADWPPNAHVTGFWFLDTAAQFKPAAELEHFLAAGPPPVAIAFGSLVDTRPAELLKALVNALAETQQRGLLLSGWSAETTVLPATIHRAGWVPLPWLLPRVRALIHHAGAGTTAEVLRAGVPSVTIPFSGEQKFWAGRLHRLGCSARPIPRPELTAAAVSRALRLILDEAQLPVRLADIARRVREENGVARAVAAFEEFAVACPGVRGKCSPRSRRGHESPSE